MFRKIRQWNLLIIIMLLLQLTVYPVKVLGNEKASITVDQAVQIVKDNFSIPENYVQLSTGYNDFNDRASYSLNWNAADQPSGSFNAEVDASTGDILNINQWEQTLKPAMIVPVLSSVEAEKIATDLVSKLAGKHQSEMQLVKDEQQVFTLNNFEPFMYNFHWIRIANGIQFPGNGVNVGVNGNGQVRSYNYHWTPDLVFPEPSNIISPAKASQVFTDTPMLELQYFLPQKMNPQTLEPQRVLLVYQLANQYSGGAIDALSGNPVTLDPQEGGYGAMNAAVGSVYVGVSTEAMAPVIKSTVQDTSANNQQISRDEAVDLVKKFIEIPSDLVLRNSSLNSDWQNSSEKIWNLDWYSESSYMGEGHYLNAQINAMTGDLVGFNMSNTLNKDDKLDALDRDGAQKVAEDFLKRAQPEAFKLVKEESDNFYGGKRPSNIQMFNYVRRVNGIPVSNNGMNITVDTVAKQVINYNKNWSKVEFPTPTNVLPLDQAIGLFLKERPLALNYSLIYQQNEQQNGQQKVRLVYQPNMNNGMYQPSMLDAMTGDPVDWFGKSQSQWVKAHHYTDIQGNYAEKEISIMGLTGAFGEYGEAFRPDEKVTTGSLLRAMLIAAGNGRDRALSDEDVAKLAQERGWVPDGLKPESELSRLDLAKYMIRLINMEPSAQVKGIYAIPFTDVNTIQPESLGYIALTWGLGILKLDGDAVQPNQIVTRAEAAYALVHAYTVSTPNSHIMK